MRTSREYPKWIVDSHIWETMCAYWDSEEAIGKSLTYSKARMSDSNGLNGTYVDRKAEKIVQNYEQILQQELSEMEAETSNVSDGESRPWELTTNELTVIFLEFKADSRGNYYGVGSFNDSLPDLVTGKRKLLGDSSSFVALQEQVKEAQQKIEEQAAYNARREAEQTKAVAEQKDKLEHFSSTLWRLIHLNQLQNLSHLQLILKLLLPLSKHS
ncbi:putative protein [Arabidopsis thaliana]|uniref:T24H24.20 protein n=1 Tax=Arabidopsis thaliana TaxID=3702 RepID=O81431_ARATH|nr:T24H24.20 gene product [Arabidopsis thaliana]CAB77878.1 putative protein [Arabidopsis thaliana]